MELKQVHLICNGNFQFTDEISRLSESSMVPFYEILFQINNYYYKLQMNKCQKERTGIRSKAC